MLAPPAEAPGGAVTAFERTFCRFVIAPGERCDEVEVHVGATPVILDGTTPFADFKRGICSDPRLTVLHGERYGFSFWPVCDQHGDGGDWSGPPPWSLECWGVRVPD